MKDDQSLSENPASRAGVWSVDAGASLQSVLDRSDTPPLLRQALTGVLSWQTRSETPVRRTLTAPRIAPQWVAALVAAGASVTVEGAEGRSQVPLASLLERRPEGTVSALHVPLGGPGRRWGESHVGRTPADVPIVSATAVVDVEGGVVRQARIALTGAWPEPVRVAEASGWLVGGLLDGPCIQAVARGVEDEVAPTGDFLGSAEYRRAMAGVTTRRALEAALRQAGEEVEGE